MDEYTDEDEDVVYIRAGQEIDSGDETIAQTNDDGIAILVIDTEEEPTRTY